jgi:hypothetical protein
MNKRPAKRVKSQTPKVPKSESVQDKQIVKDSQIPDADSKPTLFASLEKTPAEIARGGIELFVILIGLIASVIQIFSMSSGKNSTIFFLIVLFLGIFAWRYRRDLSVLLTRKTLRQIIESLRTKAAKVGLEKFLRRPNPVSFSIAVILLLSGVLVYYWQIESSTSLRYEIPLTAPGVSLFVDSYKLIPYGTPLYINVGFSSKGDVYFMADEIELQTLNSNMMFVDETGTITDTISHSWEGCIRRNSCEISTPFRILITKITPTVRLGIIARVHLRDKSEYQDLIDMFDKDFDKYYPPLPSVKQSEFSEILTIPGYIFPLPVENSNTRRLGAYTFLPSPAYTNIVLQVLSEYGNFVVKLLFAYSILALIYSFLPPKKRSSVAKNQKS